MNAASSGRTLLLIGLLLLWKAAAAEFPGGKTVVMVVPFASGGPTDRVARHLADAMHKALGGAPVVVENIPGAGGAVGAARVARAAPDGYTLLLNNIAMATLPSPAQGPSFDADQDFDYLGLVNDVPMTLIARPDLPAQTYSQLVNWVRAHRGSVTIGNAGVGSASHLCGLLLQAAWGVPLDAIPYKGTGPAMTDLIGGHFDLMCDQTTNTSAQIEARKVKAFAVTSAQRLAVPALKPLPTLQELGLGTLTVSVFHGLYAPRGTPRDVARRLNDALKEALADPRFVHSEEELGAVVVSDSRREPDAHRAFVRAERARWAPLIAASGAAAR